MTAQAAPTIGTTRRDRLILLLALACLNLYLFETPGLLDTPVGNILSALVPLVIVMPVGPLVYSYVRSCYEPKFRFCFPHQSGCPGQLLPRFLKC